MIEPDGDLDTTWGGGDGWVELDVAGGTQDIATELQELPNGDIVVAGQTYDGTRWDTVAARFDADGTLDTGFNTPTGYIVINNNSHTTAFNLERNVGMDIDQQGRIILGTDSWNGAQYNAAIIRLAAAGTTDGTFGVSGVKQLDLVAGQSEYINDVIAQPDNKILFGGTVFQAGGQRPMLGRVLATDGSLDTSTFSASGWASENTSLAEAGAFGGELLWDVDGAISTFSHNAVATGKPWIVRWDSLQVDDYIDNGTADWDSAGPMDAFGACLRNATNGATGTTGGAWVVGPGNTCPSTDGTYWNAIPAASPGAKVAYATASDLQGGATDPTAYIKFGFRTDVAQGAGTYFAPIVFETVAPNA
jgi:uncharacterized delta-60 repeat protein